MNKPQWQIDIEERVSFLAGQEWKAEETVTEAEEQLIDDGYYGPIAKLYANSQVDIPHLLAALDKMREALKIFACNEHPKILTDGSLPSCCVATQALNFDPKKPACTYCNDIKESRLGDGSIMSCQFCQPTKQEGGK